MEPSRGGRYDQAGLPYDDYDYGPRERDQPSELTRFEAVAVILGLIVAFFGAIILLIFGGAAVVVALGWY